MNSKKQSLFKKIRVEKDINKNSRKQNLIQFNLKYNNEMKTKIGILFLN